MIPTLKSEFRKLLTIRSTYIYLLASVAAEVLFAGYIGGYKASPINLHDHNLLAGDITGAVSAVSIFLALAVLLLLAHEYRYNTIMYTLTSAKSRTQVLLAKIVAVTVFVGVATVILAILSPLFTVAGIHLKGLSLVPQTLHYSDLIWRCLFFSWGYAMFALIITALVRSQVGAIVVFLLMPTTIESLLSLLLKGNSQYLPFTAIGNILEENPGIHSTHLHSMVVALIYVVGGWLIAWLLFLRRDAN